MRRRTLLWILVIFLGLLGGLAWGTLAWVPREGALYGWNTETGTLRVPEAGVAWLPRWSSRRLAGGPLSERLRAGSREGVKVDVGVSWNPQPGTYQLSPADLPAAALVASLESTVRRALSQVPLSCLVPGVADDACAGDPQTEVVKALVERLNVTATSLVVTLEPDAEAVRGALLGKIASALPQTPSKVLVLGFDGFDWDLTLPWIRAGKMPNLDRLMRAGSWGTMETLVPTLSPLIWTSIATGVAPDRHGILDFVERDPESGAMVPITGRGRRVPAVWNLASALGKQVGVVGWWASWPAERVRGVMASDRLYYTLTQGFDKDLLREDPPDLVYPPELAAPLAELRDRSVAETDFEAISAFQPITRERFDRALEEDLGMEDPVDGFRRILASTRTYLGAGLRIAADHPDLLMVYLEGTDTIGHLLSQYLPPPRIDIDPAEAELYAAAVPRYFQAVDRWIGRYLAVAPLDEYAVLLISDHGFKWGDDRPKGLSGTAGPTAPLWHENDAVFVTAGKGINALGRVDYQP
ncbi:MAG: alkaline phosphatase family protein, partial [Thermoanaerobaculia bacterium]|nr:alkaline phosphatase family protein [Thermoanaerobaculia bacterium]